MDPVSPQGLSRDKCEASRECVDADRLPTQLRDPAVRCSSHQLQETVVASQHEAEFIILLDFDLAQPFFVRKKVVGARQCNLDVTSVETLYQGRGALRCE